MPKRNYDEAFIGPELICDSPDNIRNRLIAIFHEGGDIDEEDEYGYTLLYHAVKQGDECLVESLLKQGADPGNVCINEVTPFYLALDYGHHEVAELLSDFADQELVEQTLLSAIINNNISIVRSLSPWADYNEPLYYGINSYLHPLSTAIEKGYERIIDFLLANGAQTEKALIFLLMDNNFNYREALPVIKGLLKKGVDINKIVNMGDENLNSSVLFASAYYGHYDFIKYLAQQYSGQFNVNQIVDNFTPLYAAIHQLCDYTINENYPSETLIKSYEKIIKLLLILGADLDLQGDTTDCTINELLTMQCESVRNEPSQKSLQKKINEWSKNRHSLLNQFYYKTLRNSSVGGFFKLFTSAPYHETKFPYELESFDKFSDVTLYPQLK